MPTISQGRITDPAPLPPTLCLSHGRRSPSTNAASADHGHLHLGPRQQIADPAPLPRPLSQSWMLLTFPSAASADRDHHPPGPRQQIAEPAHLPPSLRITDHRIHIPPGPRIADPAPLPCPVSQSWILLSFSQCCIRGLWSPSPGAAARDCGRPRTTAAILPQQGSLTPEPTVTGKALQLRPPPPTPKRVRLIGPKYWSPILKKKRNSFLPNLECFGKNATASQRKEPRVQLTFLAPSRYE